MRALVTGARGFIGSFLVEELVNRGMEVRCLLRKKKSGSGGWLDDQNIMVYEGDITDCATLADAVKDVDYAFHLAGLTKAVNNSEFERINVNGTMNLLEAIQNINPKLKKVVFVSSLAAAGPAQSKQPLTENDTARPISNYGKSKLRAEEAVLNYTNDIPISIVRPPSVFGPRDKDMFNIFKFTKHGWRIILSGRSRFASVIYVKDLVRGLILVAEKEHASGELYYLCNNESYSWDSFGGEVAKAMGKHTRTVVIPLALAFLVSCGFEFYSKLFRKAGLFNLDKYKELKAAHWICDNAKAQNDLGFQIKYGLQEALQETADWYFANGWL